MSKLFDNIKNDMELSVEQIAYQPNDIIVDQLVSCFTILKEEAKTAGSYVRFKNKNKVIDALIELENNMYKRFGIHFKILNFEGYNAAAFTTHPNDVSAINKWTPEIHAELMQLYADSDLEKNDEKLDKIHSTDFEADEKGEPSGTTKVIYMKLLDDINKVTEAMNSKGVTFDLKKARIDGLPSDYKAIMIMDAYNFLGKWDMSPRELAAIMLHETGHIFTHMQYSYRSVAMTSTIIEAVREASRKNLSNRETIIVAVDKVIGDKSFSNKHKDSNTVSVAIDAIPTLLDSLKLNGSNLNTIDSEQKADEFAAMFGLGKDLVSGLNILNKEFKSMYYKQIGMMALLAIISTILFIFSFMVGGLLAGLINTFSPILMLPIIMLISIIVMAVLTYLYRALILGGGTKEENVYDESKKRMERIKFDIIRAMRTQELPDDVKNYMAKSVSDIDRVLNMLPDDKEYSMLDKFVMYVHRPSAKRKEARDIEQLTEAIMENTLHSNSVKIDDLIKKRK